MKGKHDGQLELMSGCRAWKVFRAGEGLYRQVTDMLVLEGDLWSPRCIGIMDRVIW